MFMRRFAQYTPVIVFACLIGTVAVAQDDNSAAIEALNSQAAADVRRGRFDQAMEAYRQIVEYEPDWPDHWYNMGEVGRVSHNPADCALYFSRYVYLRPSADDHAEVVSMIARCVREMDDKGTISVTATPEDGEIAIDGAAIAAGSLASFALVAGDHQLTVTAEDWVSYNQSFTVVAGEEQTVTVALERMLFYGTIVLRVNLDGAAVSIDDAPVGMTPLDSPITVENGEHLVRLTKDGYYDWVRRITIERDEVLPLDVTLQEEE
jgi:tetratricopeptide (TPR) repeat protein